jgi:nicotinamidase-related amidase
MRRITRDSATLVIIDVQEKLMPVIDRHEEVARNIERLIHGAALLAVPRIVTEQYVKGLGPTIPALRKALEETGGYEPLEKMCFSSFGFAPFAERLRQGGRRDVLLCGIETHVCVYQTALDLLEHDFAVHLLTDAVSSRAAANRETAIRRLESEGAKLTTTEMALFELTVTSGTDEFKRISKLVK